MYTFCLFIGVGCLREIIVRRAPKAYRQLIGLPSPFVVSHFRLMLLAAPPRLVPRLIEMAVASI